MIVTAGALAALNVVPRTLLDPGDRVLVGSPTYPERPGRAPAARSRLVAAPLPEEGWDFDTLEAAARQSAPRLAYLIPDFHNPTGRLMSGRDRAEQLRRLLAAAACRPVIDETLVELRLDGAVMPPPFAARRRGRDHHRLGQQGVLGRAADRLDPGAARPGPTAGRGSGPCSTSAAAAFEQLVLAELLTDPAPLLAEQRTRLRVQRDHLVGELPIAYPTGGCRRPAAGLVLWVELPTGVQRAGRGGERARRDHHPGPRFFLGGGGERHLRLPFTAPAGGAHRGGGRGSPRPGATRGPGVGGRSALAVADA